MGIRVGRVFQLRMIRRNVRGRPVALSVGGWAALRGDFVGNVGVAGVSAGGRGSGVGAILRTVHGVTWLLLRDLAGSSPDAFCPNLGRLAAGVGAMCATAPLVSGRRRT